MRALVVSHTANSGIADHLVGGVLRHRPPHAVACCVYLEHGPDVQAVRELGVEAKVIPAGHARDAWRVPRVVGAVTRLIRRRDIQVVLSHTSKAQIYGAPAATIARVPSVWFEPGPPGAAPGLPGRGGSLQAIAARLPNRLIICNSDFVARQHVERSPRSPVRRVYPGIATDGVVLRRHEESRRVRMAIVGRLLRWRRLELALEALALVLAEEPEVVLSLVGDARPDVDVDYPAELRARAEALGIAHAVEFAGAVADEGAAIGEADILLHVTPREPFGKPVAQALLRGVPAIVPPDGGPAEFVRHGVDGLIADPADAEALAAAILALARDPRRRSAMGAAGHARAVELFDERHMAADIWELLEGAATGRLTVDRSG